MRNGTTYSNYSMSSSNGICNFSGNFSLNTNYDFRVYVNDTLNNVNITNILPLNSEGVLAFDSASGKAYFLTNKIPFRTN